MQYVKRKKLRRKSLFQKRSGSTGSQGRPKKRCREENDMFGLDKLIGIMSQSEAPLQKEQELEDESFVTPVQNICMVNLGVEESRDTVDTTGFDESLRQPVEIISTQLENHQKVSEGEVDETKETVALGIALGAADLDSFIPNVKQVLRSEGYQVGEL